MQRSKRIAIALICVLGIFADSAFAARRKPARVKPANRSTEFSDKAVEQAIKKGVEYLLSVQNAKGVWQGWGGKYPLGPTALATYALIESGVSPRDPRMDKALKALSEGKMTMTYCIGLRANAYLAAMKKGATEYQKYLIEDVKILLKSTKDGSYNYVSDGAPRSGDNSNSQYGLLGVWAGAQAGLEGIPTDYWKLVMKHWQSCQCGDGGWTYRGKGGARNTMTAAGVASLFVCFDNLYQDKFINCAGVQEYMPLKRGLDWFEKNFQRTLGGGRWFFYYLYGVERVGLAAGYKYFGTADWYKLGATALLRAQGGNGAWSGGDQALVDTSFAILFLIRGRQPVMFNKLEFDGDWNNRPRDCAYLVRWMSKVFEKDLSWQIINLRTPVEDWHDAPILYISASRHPKFSDEDLEKLREFVWQGGTILSSTECDGRSFSQGMREAYKRLFPGYALRALEKDHPIYSIRPKFQGRVKLEMISNGIRPLAIHTDVDLSKYWQLQRISTHSDAFEIAAAVYMYVTDGTFRNRGVSLWPAKPNATPEETVKIARLRYGGNYDPEPFALKRFGRLMGHETNVTVEPIGPIFISELAGSGAKVASLTGTSAFKLTAEDTKLLKEFLEDGGTLVIDAAGGSKEFDGSASALMRALASAGELRRLSASSPIHQLKDWQINKIRYRLRTEARIGRNRSNLSAVLVFGRPAAIYSPEDITGALVGYPSYPCDGYSPESAYELMRNIVFYSMKD